MIGPAVVQRRVDLVVLHPRLGGEEPVGPADGDAVGRKWKVVGRDQLHAVGIDIDRGRAFDGVGHAFESDPQAGVAAHRPAMQAEVDDFLHRRGIQHRHHGRRELMVGLMRKGRRFRRVIVAGEHQHATMLRGAREIGMLEHVAAAVHTRPLAVPHREHAVVLGAGVHVDLLAAPDRGRGQVLVQARPELDVRLGEKLFRAPQRKVERAQRRAAIAGYEAGGVQSGQYVALALQHQQAHQRLNAGHIDAAGLELVFVVESDLAQGVRAAGRRGHRTISKNFVLDCAVTGYGPPPRARRLCRRPVTRRGFYALDPGAANALPACRRVELDHLPKAPGRRHKSLEST